MSSANGTSSPRMSGIRRKLTKRQPGSALELQVFPAVEDAPHYSVSLPVRSGSSSIQRSGSLSSGGYSRETKSTGMGLWKRAFPFKNNSDRFKLPIQEPPPFEVTPTLPACIEKVADIPPLSPPGHPSERPHQPTIRRPATAPSAWRDPNWDASAGGTQFTVTLPILKTDTDTIPTMSRSRSLDTLNDNPVSVPRRKQASLDASPPGPGPDAGVLSVPETNVYTLNASPRLPAPSAKLHTFPSSLASTIVQPHLNQLSVTTNNNPMVERPQHCRMPLKSSLKRERKALNPPTESSVGTNPCSIVDGFVDPMLPGAAPGLPISTVKPLQLSRARSESSVSPPETERSPRSIIRTPTMPNIKATSPSGESVFSSPTPGFNDHEVPLFPPSLSAQLRRPSSKREGICVKPGNLTPKKSELEPNPPQTLTTPGQSHSQELYNSDWKATSTSNKVTFPKATSPVTPTTVPKTRMRTSSLDGSTPLSHMAKTHLYHLITPARPSPPSVTDEFEYDTHELKWLADTQKGTLADRTTNKLSPVRLSPPADRTIPNTISVPTGGGKASEMRRILTAKRSFPL